jgi:uncharacterized membrane protein SpoIIM required for sporulation
MGAIFSAGSPEFASATQAQYGKSVVNQTYSEVKEQISHENIPLVVGIGLFLVIFIINNLFFVTLIVFLPYYFNNYVGVISTSYLLFISGFIPGAIFARVIGVLGTSKTIIAFIPHGVFEFTAVIIAGYLAYYYLLNGAQDKSKPYMTRVYLKIVVPLILTAAAMEVFITPILIYLV